MKINIGNIVVLDYEGKLENGEIFDSSKHEDHSHPLEFEVGKGNVIKGFDNAVLGMEVGEEKEFEIEPKDAYGEYNPKLFKEIPKSALGIDQKIKPGTTLVMTTPEGLNIPLKVLDTTEETVKVDVNHPLAGKKLIFKIKILEIKNSQKN